MTILLDTNIVLDILLNRKEFVENSKKCVEIMIDRADNIYISASQITDIYYILSKGLNSKEQALSTIKTLSVFVCFAPVDDTCIQEALSSDIDDFEDAVVLAVAHTCNADVILTRNKKDFAKSNFSVLTPDEHLSQYN